MLGQFCELPLIVKKCVSARVTLGSRLFLRENVLLERESGTQGMPGSVVGIIWKNPALIELD